MEIGVLALQGGFELHISRLRELGASVREVRKAADLEGLDGIVLPGGESTTLLKLLDPALKARLKTALKELPVLATCAGLILLAKDVTNPEQESLGILDIEVSRNSYGRQSESFTDNTIRFTPLGRSSLEELGAAPVETVEGVFIRAPRITRVDAPAQVLATHQEDPVLVRQGRIFGATFHPELSEEVVLHRLFLQSVASSPSCRN